MSNDNDNPIPGIFSQQEHTCEICQKKFIARADSWAYQIANSGKKIHWYCRYNCTRAGERKIKESRAEKKERNKLPKGNKPEKEVLENDLKAGLTIKQLADKYEVHRSAVSLWIKNYNLQGVKEAHKPEDVIPADKPTVITEQSIINTGLEVGPKVYEPSNDTQLTPEEIERFYADTEEQELPKVEMEPVVPLETTEQEEDEPLAITMEPEPEAPLETIDDVWAEARVTLVTLGKIHMAEARKLFRVSLHELFNEILNELK